MPYKDKDKARVYNKLRKRRIKGQAMCLDCGSELGWDHRFRRCTDCTRKRRNKSCNAWKAAKKSLGLCVNCGKQNTRGRVTLCAICNATKARSIRNKEQARKASVFGHYGGQCCCCGESEIAFLSIDHIDNNGHEELLTGYRFYRKIEKLGYPSNLRVLCHNCNLGRHINGGACPHGKGI